MTSSYGHGQVLQGISAENVMKAKFFIFNDKR